MKNYIRCEDENGNVFFKVLNDIDEEIASIEKELIEKGYVILEVGYLQQLGEMYPIIFAKKKKTREEWKNAINKSEEGQEGRLAQHT